MRIAMSERTYMRRGLMGILFIFYYGSTRIIKHYHWQCCSILLRQYFGYCPPVRVYIRGPIKGYI